MAYTTINKSTDYFNTKLYTGTGSSNAITGIGFQPDWTWIKCRDDTHNHQVFDAVRGVYKRMRTDTTGAETTSNESLKSFDSDGFTLGTQANVNNNSNTFASWNWKAGTSVSGNTTGSGTAKTYTGSVNTTAGFSIIAYTGNGTIGHEIPHHLGVSPSMIIIKCRSNVESWFVYHKSMGNNKDIHLDFNGAEGTATSWNNTTPSATTWTMSNQSAINGDGNTNVAYCFAEKKGFSKFGSYVGNGNADGTFIYTGFKPAFVMIKRTSNSDNWYMKDNKRSGTLAGQNFGQMNPNQTQHPSANNSSAENKASAFATDILSNGFKLRGTDAGINQSGESYIYMCFAEAPLVGSNNVPCTAR
ncbi:hypothetical protein [uncultured Mediterranean phage uvMED]|nr:hypothetical protein [uncultured Mediterranean phage uvMED]